MKSWKAAAQWVLLAGAVALVVALLDGAGLPQVARNFGLLALVCFGMALLGVVFANPPRGPDA